MTELEMDAVAPPCIDSVAVVGAMNSVEEAVQANQMRFILAWAMRLETVAKGQRPAASSNALPPM